MTVKWLPNETVAVYGYSRKPVRLMWHAWKKWTDAAITQVERAVVEKQPRTREIENSICWLRACGVADKASFFGLKERLALLAQPGDASRIIRCQCCGIPLSDPVSKALGLGPVCRKGEKKRASATTLAGGV